MILDEISNHQITLQHLISLLKAVICLHDAEILHGDVCERNVCVQGSSIQLIDFGGIGLIYGDDAEATGHLFLRCVDRMTISDDQAAEIRQIAWKLIYGEDLNWALSI